MTIMLLAALASEKALLGSDTCTTATVPGAANDALIGRVAGPCGDYVQACAGGSGDVPRAQPVEPDGFPLAL